MACENCPVHAHIDHIKWMKAILVPDIDICIDILENEYHAWLLTMCYGMDAQRDMVNVRMFFHISKKVHTEVIEAQIHDGDA